MELKIYKCSSSVFCLHRLLDVNIAYHRNDRASALLPFVRLPLLTDHIVHLGTALSSTVTQRREHTICAAMRRYTDTDKATLRSI